MDFPFLGELAAFATVFCWVAGSQFIEAASKRVGSFSTIMMRFVIGLFMFSGYSLITLGHVVPLDFPFHAWGWLLVSGVVGIALGDLCLFRAFVEIGPRLSMLIMSLSVPITAIIGWSFLGESYGLQQWAGMAVTLFGVGMVTQEKSEKQQNVTSNRKVRPITIKGIFLAFGGAVGQAVGYTMSKQGMTTEGAMLDPFAATQIRVIGGFMGFVVFISILGMWSKVLVGFQDRKALTLMGAGTFLGLGLGVGLSLQALHYTSTGIASTILSLVPIFLIPFAIFLHKEHVSNRALLGTVVAFCGILLLLYEF